MFCMLLPLQALDSLAAGGDSNYTWREQRSHRPVPISCSKQPPKERLANHGPYGDACSSDLSSVFPEAPWNCPPLASASPEKRFAKKGCRRWSSHRLPRGLSSHALGALRRDLLLSEGLKLDNRQWDTARQVPPNAAELLAERFRTLDY